METNELDQIVNFRNYLKNETPLSNNTIKQYIHLVRRFIITNGKGLEFTMQDINSWIASKCRKKNYNLPPYAMQHFLISLGRKDLVHKIMHQKVMPRKKVFRYIEKKILEEIINSLDWPYQLYALMQVKAGFRIRELLLLKIQNLDFHRNNNLIYITLGADTKGSKGRLTRISKKYKPIIKKQLKGRTFGYMFIPENKQGSKEKIDRWCDNEIRYFNDRLFKLGQEHDINGMSSHYLRHCFSDYFMEIENSSIVQLQRILGHSHLNTTANYINDHDKNIDNIFESMD